jgi:hypothetical protein
MGIGAMTEKDAASKFYRTLKTRVARKMMTAMGFENSSSGECSQNTQNISQRG